MQTPQHTSSHGRHHLAAEPVPNQHLSTSPGTCPPFGTSKGLCSSLHPPVPAVCPHFCWWWQWGPGCQWVAPLGQESQALAHRRQWNRPACQRAGLCPVPLLRGDPVGHGSPEALTALGGWRGLLERWQFWGEARSPASSQGLRWGHGQPRGPQQLPCSLGRSPARKAAQQRSVSGSVPAQPWRCSSSGPWGEAGRYGETQGLPQGEAACRDGA